ncbi:MAG TPA: Nif3-like dinuclear metal center hexameric protein [Solirubrobacteraceae bacterium]|nr:Nif3-like dinuclear metal center hexameric protein [Solirubrobacteraceae bacterium]
MPTTAGEIVAVLDELLHPASFADYCPNGLQVPGRERVQRLVSGVSAQLELFGRARELGADLVLVHHGLFWGSGPQPIDAAQKARLRALFDADIGLLAYHLPLDAHPQLGNNALLAEGLQAARSEPFAEHRGQPIGRRVWFEGPGVPADELLARVHALTGREPLAFLAGPERVRTMGIVSGAAAGHLDDAIALGLDAFLTGEPAERVMAQARESRIHFIAAGHYATETFGVRRVGELLAARFDLEHTFVDVPNPV